VPGAAWMVSSARPSLTVSRPHFTRKPSTISRGVVLRVSEAEPEVEPRILDRRLTVKISLASGSGRLDMSDMRLTELPQEIFDIPGEETRWCQTRPVGSFEREGDA
jgi:hypothetical protein